MTRQIETRLFINGEYVDANGTARMSSHNPVDNSLITDNLHVAGEEDVNAAVAAARAAFPAWAGKQPSERAALLNKLADLIEANREEIADLEILSGGKTKLIANLGEITMSVRYLRYYAGWCDKLTGESMPTQGGFMTIVSNEPLGVCAAICPFNAPITMLAAKISPALAAGNTIIIKPSEKTPLGSLVFGRLSQEAGFPPGVINILSGPGSTGALLASHMNINKVSFTGSIATGKKVAQMAAASNLKRVGLELGGKSPVIILPDANLDVATKFCVQGIVILTGQVCIANSRIYVHKSIREDFLSRFKAGLQALEASIGDPASNKTTVGPLIDKSQFDKVMGYIESGKQEAKLLQGGTQHGDKGCFVTPTIFVDSDPNARIYKEEIFGPVAVVNDFEDEDEVIARANDSEYGLSASVFSQDINSALRVAAKLESGCVNINCTVQSQLEVPFGGVKQSGWGRENGKYGILAYTEPKTTFINLGY